MGVEIRTKPQITEKKRSQQHSKRLAKIATLGMLFQHSHFICTLSSPPEAVEIKLLQNQRKSVSSLYKKVHMVLLGDSAR